MPPHPPVRMTLNVQAEWHDCASYWGEVTIVGKHTVEGC